MSQNFQGLNHTAKTEPTQNRTIITHKTMTSIKRTDNMIDREQWTLELATTATSTRGIYK